MPRRAASRSAERRRPRAHPTQVHLTRAPRHPPPAVLSDRGRLWLPRPLRYRIVVAPGRLTTTDPATRDPTPPGTSTSAPRATRTTKSWSLLAASRPATPPHVTPSRLDASSTMAESALLSTACAPEPPRGPRQPTVNGCRFLLVPCPINSATRSAAVPHVRQARREVGFARWISRLLFGACGSAVRRSLSPSTRTSHSRATAWRTRACGVWPKRTQRSCIRMHSSSG